MSDPAQRCIMTIDAQLLVKIVDGDMRGVEIMLAAGACIDGCQDYPIRPIVAAAQTGQVRILEMLIGRGADLEVVISTEMCDENGVARYLLGSRALHGAVSGTQLGSVRCLLRARANPDVITSQGLTPLMMAFHSPEIVAELLKGGADPAFATGEGMTALHYYASNGASDEAMGLLLEAAPSTLNKVCSP